MAVEQITNNAQTSLNGAINNAVTSIVVASASGFPTGGNFRIIVDNEIMLVTACAGTTWTVTRAAEGTSAASHVDTSTVTLILTAAGLSAFRGDLVTAGAYSALTAAGTAGRLFKTSDGPFLMRDNGVSHDAYGPLDTLYVPSDTGYSWINQGGSSLSTTNGELTLSVPASAAKHNRIRVKSAAAPYTYTARLRGLAFPSDFWNFGLLFRESGSGKLHAFQIGHVTNVIMASTKFTDADTYSADYVTASVISLPMGVPEWFKIEDDNSSRICSFSYDGTNWQVFHTVGRTDFLTADQVGYFANSENSKAVTLAVRSLRAA